MSEIELEKAIQKSVLLNTLASDSKVFPLDDDSWNDLVNQVDRAIDRFFKDVQSTGTGVPDSGIRYFVGDKVDTSAECSPPAVHSRPYGKTGVAVDG